MIWCLQIFMPLSFHTIQPARGAKKSKQRIGRGGKRGTYSGKGQKGQRARSGGRHRLKRLGLKPLMEQTPKLRGFKSRQPRPEIVNLRDLARKFKDGEKVTPQILLSRGLVDKINNGVKILGQGEINIKLTVSGCKISAGAKDKIEKEGGAIK